MNKTHTLIISDIHLGSEICKPAILLKILSLINLMPIISPPLKETTRSLFLKKRS